MLYVMLGHVVMLSSLFCTEFGWRRVTQSPVKVVEPCSQIAVFTSADAAQSTSGGNEMHMCRVMAPPTIWRVNLSIASMFLPSHKLKPQANTASAMP